MKKILSIMLVVMMLVGMLPMNAIHSHAAELSETMTIAASTGTVSGESISWSSGNLSFTANKNTSSNAIRTSDSDHFRLYVGFSATLTCSAGNITKIVMTATGSSYAVAPTGSDGSKGTVSGTTITIVPKESSNTYTIPNITAQTRIKTITVTYATVDSGECAHTNTETIEAVAATCTTAGNTAGTKCADCGVVLSGNEAIEALGHTNDAGVVTAPTCTEDGYTLYTCTVCGSAKKSDYVDATGHNYVDGVCSVCSVAMPTGLNGKYYIAAKRSSGNYMYMTNDLGTANTKRYQQVDSGLTELPAIIDAPVAAQVFELIFDAATATYKIKSGDQYLGWTSDNSGILVDEAAAIAATIENSDVEGAYLIHFTASDAERYLALNNTTGNNYFAWYKSGQVQDLYLVPVNPDWESDIDTPDPEATEPEATEPEATEPAGSYELATYIAEGDTVVLVAKDIPMELSAISTTSTKYGLGVAYTDVPAAVMPLTVVAGSATGTYAFQTADGNYLYWTSGNSLNVNATLSANTSWTVSFDESGNAIILNGADAGRQIWWNISSPRFACYTGKSAGSSYASVQLYKYVSAGACEHVWGEWVETTAATCTNAGVETATCSACGETKTQSIAATGHTYVYGDAAITCANCDYSAAYTLSTIAEVNAAGLALAYEKYSTDVYYAKGIVTYISGKNVYLEDATGGFCVYFSTVPEGIALGDEYLVWDKAYNYNGLIEFSGTAPASCIKVSSDNELPIKTVTIAELLADTTNSYLGERVQIEGVRMGVLGTNNTALYDDSNKTVNIYKAPALAEEVTEEDIVNVIAVVSAYKGNYQLVINPGTAATDVVVVENREPIVLKTVTIAEAKAGTAGTFYQVEGTVTFVDGRNVYVQDATGGIVVYLTANAATTKVGDNIRAYGSLKFYSGLIELDAVDETNSRFYEIKSSSNTVESQTVTIETLKNDATNEYLAEKITLENVYVSYHTSYSETYSNVTYVLTDGKGNTIDIYRAPVDGTEDDCLAGGTIVNVEAIVSSYNGYQLRIADIDSITYVGTCAHETTELVVETAATLAKPGVGNMECTVCGTYTQEDIEIPALTNVAGWSLTLGSDITVNFKLEIAAEIRESAQIKITVGDDAYTYNAAEYGNADDNFCTVSVKAAAAQMADTITVQVVNGEDASAEKTYTILDYAKTVLADENMSQYHEVVKAMLHYGAAAQTYFEHNDKNLVNADIGAAENVDLTAVTVNDIVVSGEAEGIQFYGASLLFKDQIVVRFYFVGNAGDIEGAVQVEDKFYIDSKGILPQDLDVAATVTIGDLYVSYSPLNYIVRMAEKGSENLQALVKALYRYHEAAEVLAPDVV